MSVYIIAEAGVNHNGSVELAKQMIDEARKIGADCIKFQTFISDKIVSKYAEKAEYQKKSTETNETQYIMLKKLELTYDDFKELNEYCKIKNIEFLSTAFDIESLGFLNSLGVNKFKVPSGDITNLPYLIEMAKFRKPIILSTGMSTLDEVENSVRLLKENGAEDISILHCTTEYPAPFDEVNLRVIESLRDKFDCKVGYSDHTEGIEVAVAAVALGAEIIEKHFTLDRNMEGPDHKASINVDEFRKMVDSIRNVEKAMGSGEKKPSKTEQKNIKAVRKSIFAKKDIKIGDVFSEENLTTMRPGDGINPMRWFEVIGKTSSKNFEKGEKIEI